MTPKEPIDLKAICQAFAYDCNSVVIGNRWISFRSLNMIERFREDESGEEYLVLKLSTAEEIVLTPEESADFYGKIKDAALLVNNHLQQQNSQAMRMASQALKIDVTKTH